MPASPPAPPTPADDPILAALARFHVLTAAQVQRLLYAPGSRKYAPLRLRNLVAGGYVLVDYPAPPRKAGRARGIYALDARGRRYVAEVLELEVPPRFRPAELVERSWSFYAHTLAVNDVLIAAELLERDRVDVELVETRHELALKRAPIRVSGNGGGDALIPDGFLVFRVRAGERTRRFPLCLEVDMGTMGPREWRGKIGRYLAALDGPLERAFGVARATVAVVAAPGPARRDRLREWTLTELAARRAEEVAGRFLFTGHDPAAAPPAELFFGSVFFPPAAPAPAEPLLVAPAASG